MKRDMSKWFEGAAAAKKVKALPILGFPVTQIIGMTVGELLGSSENMAKGICAVAERVDMAAGLGMMDLSVESEAFGANVVITDNEVPTVTGRLVADRADADRLAVPSLVGTRAERYIRAIELAVSRIADRPVFACMLGPFSFAGRLMDVSEAMMNCYDDPDMVHVVLEKASAFQIEYAKRYKAIGANGIFIAEPLAGILSPALIDEFSTPYCKKIVDAIKDDNFAVAYHNCGPTLPLASSIMKIGASAYHFGNAIELEKMFEIVPRGTIVMGNVDPASQFKNGTPESIRKATLELLEKCSRYAGFIPSSGCDIPPTASWDNIDAFFGAVDEFYK